MERMTGGIGLISNYARKHRVTPKPLKPPKYQGFTKNNISFFTWDTCFWYFSDFRCLMHNPGLESVPKYPYFLSCRQSLSPILLEISNRFPPAACGNDKFGQTINTSHFSSQVIPSEAKRNGGSCLRQIWFLRLRSLPWVCLGVGRNDTWN